MTLKEQEFSLAAKVLGAGTGRIIFKHLIINSMGPIIVSVTMLVPSAIFYEAFLGFLGIGLSAPQASWERWRRSKKHPDLLSAADAVADFWQSV